MEENESNIAVRYRRRGSVGTLTLSGCVDIFEAAALLEAARRAGADSAARTVRADLTGVSRLDLSAAQILLALGREIREAGRDWQPEGLPEAVSSSLSQIGVAL